LPNSREETDAESNQFAMIGAILAFM